MAVRGTRARTWGAGSGSGNRQPWRRRPPQKHLHGTLESRVVKYEGLRVFTRVRADVWPMATVASPAISSPPCAVTSAPLPDVSVLVGFLKIG